MDFLRKSLLYCLIKLLFLIRGCLNSCSVKSTRALCNSTVICNGRPTSASVQTCGENSNVTFVINSSVQETLTTGFFSSTNFDSSIRYIMANNNSWHTIDSRAFRYYIKSRMINLTANDIYNVNDDAFSDLTYLTTLDLSNNHIEKLKPTSLNIVRGNKLKMLDLSYNRLLYLQNDVFASLSNLTKLDIKNNKLMSLYKDCFSNLGKLTHLCLQNNELTSLNDTLLPLRELQFLDLSFNKIKTLFDYETTRVNALLHLNLSYNELETLDRNSFTQALELQTLDLSHNKIHSPIEAVMFMNNHLMSYLSLYDNKLTTIKDLSFASSRFRYINLEKNNLLVNITYDTLKGLSNITELIITQQNVTSIEEKAFVVMRHLQYLNLSRNNIKVVHNTSFNFVTDNVLTILDFSYNKIYNLLFLQHFKSNLVEIYLNFNKLTSLPEGTFKNHDKVIKLDLSGNEIIIIEKYSLPLHRLQYLNVDNNKFNGNITRDIFSPAPFIKNFNLSNFQFKTITENAFQNLPMLVKLNLSNNDIGFIHTLNFFNMEEMITLDVSNNKLTELNVSNKLDNLKNIYFNNNKLTRLPELFTNASKVSIVDVSNNYISNLENAGFENLLNVTYLKISHNKIDQFNNKYINKLTNLLNLILNFNNIREIKLSYFGKLINLELNHNNISHINSTTFENLQSLQYLDLSMNNIQNLPPGTFQYLKSLKFLNISSNLITNLRYGSFKGLVNTYVLDLSKNKISYLDVDILHNCAELVKLIIDYNFIKIIDVNRLINIAPNLVSLSIGGNPISCKEIVRAVQLKEFKKLEITSIHQIFHDDNVHGIKCGNSSYLSSSTEASLEKNVNKPFFGNKEEIGSSFMNILVTSCVIITIFAILALFIYIYYYKRQVNILLRRVPEVYQTNSLRVSSVEYNENLLN